MLAPLIPPGCARTRWGGRSRKILMPEVASRRADSPHRWGANAVWSFAIGLGLAGVNALGCQLTDARPAPLEWLVGSVCGWYVADRRARPTTVGSGCSARSLPKGLPGVYPMSAPLPDTSESIKAGYPPQGPGLTSWARDLSAPDGAGAWERLLDHEHDHAGEDTP